jgi:phosphoglucomutase
MTTLEKIQSAAKSGALLPSTAVNLADWLAASLPAWASASINELVEHEAWSELNDRFYRYLEFGTGGMRGRTIGKVTAAAETGTLSPLGTPGHAAIGSNVLNDFTLIRATIGLYRHTAKHLAAHDRAEPPKLVIAHDVRHFSRHFCELAASTWARLGGAACIFDGARSTPQLSFTVRHLCAHAGIVITASHNPSHDNGFKAYFEDGAQVIAPHDTAIVAEVNAVPLTELAPDLDKNLARVITLPPAADAAYQTVAAESLLDKKIIRRAKLKIAYTNIHGVGAHASVPLLRAAGAEVTHVPAQASQDPRFPTVKSPNPENAEALSIAVALAEKNNLDLVLATDPDCDRMGVAVRNRSGKMELLTGNQTGVLFADYRIAKLKQLGLIPKRGGQNSALIKTYVTTPLQDAIARAHGIKVINTLTGFKWIAAKIRRYEEQLKTRLLAKEGIALDYDRTPQATRAKLLQKHSTYYIFGNEESYGYLGSDDARDKDGNTACLMFAELCAHIKTLKLTVPEYLDQIYRKHGYYTEDVINIYYEGATGAAKIKRILDTYRSAPPKKFGDIAVKKFQDFGRQKFHDADREPIPAQDLYFVTLANGYTFAARGSGTEPKIKFYLFANAKIKIPKGKKQPPDLAATKTAVKAELERIKTLVEADARERAET